MFNLHFSNTMKTFAKSLVLLLLVSTATFATPVADTKAPSRPTTPVTYRVGVFPSGDGASLNVVVDKQSGGKVDILLKDVNGNVLYNQRVGKKEATIRVKLNLSQLADGQYRLDVTNGAQTTTQNVTLSTKTPVQPERLVSMN